MDRKETRKRCGAGLARTRAEAVEMLSPLETGTARRQLRDVGGVGKPEPRAGSCTLAGGARGTGKARQLADLVRRGQARSPASHTWRGPCFILPDTSASARTGIPASILTPAAGIPGPPSARTAPRPTRRGCPRTRTRGPASISDRPPGSSARDRPAQHPRRDRLPQGCLRPGPAHLALPPHHPRPAPRGRHRRPSSLLPIHPTRRPHLNGSTCPTHTQPTRRLYLTGSSHHISTAP